MSQFKVIPQKHLGVRFRSRTEARWAEFFARQGIPFSYEPEGIGNGTEAYLVDFEFVATERVTYFEVKPRTPTAAEYKKLVNLARAMSAHVFVSHGPPSASCVIEKVYRSGERQRWYFAYAHEETCGYLVDCLYAANNALALRETKKSPGMYGRGPEDELNAAGRFQFDDPGANQRAVASSALRNSSLVRPSMEREVVRRRHERLVVRRGC